MRSFTPLLVFILSFVSFVVSGPLHSNTHSSRLTKSYISSRQFHYPRALVDVCAGVDLSLALGDTLGLNLGSLTGDICLCLSAFPLDLDLDADIETRLKSYVEKSGTHCSYPDHASPKCTSGNACDFTCMDGFVKNGGTCLCPRSNSVCNGKCGSHPHGCSSAVPRAPKITRRSITPSHNGRSSHDEGSHGPNSGGVNLAANANLNLGGLLDGLLGGSGLDLDALVNKLLKSLGISAPVSGGHQSSGLEAELHICIGADISGTQSLLDTITDVVNSLLSSLLGATVECKLKSSCSSSVDPHAISIDLQVCGLSALSLESTLDKALKGVANLLNGFLDGANIVTNCNVGGSGCPATPTIPSPSHPFSSPSTSVDVSYPNVSPSPSAGTDFSGLLNGASNDLLAQVGGVLGELGLGLGNYTLDTGADLVVGVSVGLNNTLSSIDGLVAMVITLVDETLDLLLATDVTVQTDSDQSSSSAPSHPSQGDGIVVDIDLGVVLDAALSDTAELVDGVLSAVSGVLATLLKADVAVNVDGGHSCGCSGSKRASAKQ